MHDEGETVHLTASDGFRESAGARSAQGQKATLQGDAMTIALGPHSRGCTGGRVDALLGVEGATVGASVWLRGAGGLSLTCELGPATADLCASWVALDRLERAVNGLVR